ncbi:MAG: hypothetical protein AAF637_00905 [Pseudomonadota bacterium]
MTYRGAGRRYAGDRLQAVQELVARHRGTLENRQGDRVVAFGQAHEVSHKRHVAVGRDDQQTAIDHQIGRFDEVPALKFNALARLGRDLKALARRRIADLDQGAAEGRGIQGDAACASLGDCWQIFRRNPSEGRGPQRLLERIDEDRSLAAVDSTSSVLDSILEGLHAWIVSNQGDDAVGADLDPAAVRLADRDGQGISIWILCRYRKRKRCVFRGEDAQIFRLRRGIRLWRGLRGRFSLCRDYQRYFGHT